MIRTPRLMLSGLVLMVTAGCTRDSWYNAVERAGVHHFSLSPWGPTICWSGSPDGGCIDLFRRSETNWFRASEFVKQWDRTCWLFNPDQVYCQANDLTHPLPVASEAFVGLEPMSGLTASFDQMCVVVEGTRVVCESGFVPPLTGPVRLHADAARPGICGISEDHTVTCWNRDGLWVPEGLPERLLSVSLGAVPCWVDLDGIGWCASESFGALAVAEGARAVNGAGGGAAFLLDDGSAVLLPERNWLAHRDNPILYTLSGDVAEVSVFSSPARSGVCVLSNTGWLACDDYYDDRHIDWTADGR